MIDTKLYRGFDTQPPTGIFERAEFPSNLEALIRPSSELLSAMAALVSPPMRGRRRTKILFDRDSKNVERQLKYRRGEGGFDGSKSTGAERRR